MNLELRKMSSFASFETECPATFLMATRFPSHNLRNVIDDEWKVAVQSGNMRQAEHTRSEAIQVC
jgi:hypothetical protein